MDEYWGNTIFLKPAHDMMKRLDKIYNSQHERKIILYELDTVQEFKKVLKMASFYEFNYSWKHHDKGRHTYRLIPNNGTSNIVVNNYVSSRCNEKKYFTLSFAQNFLNKFKHKHCSKNKLNTSPMCRFCSNEVEDIEHILGKCTKLDYTILRRNCKNLNLKFDCRTLLTEIKLKISVERFIGNYFQ